MHGIIIENISNLYRIKAENKIYEATARGKFKQNEITPVVGDNVEIEILDEENRKAVIEEIGERKVPVTDTFFKSSSSEQAVKPTEIRAVMKVSNANLNFFIFFLFLNMNVN